MSVTIIASVKSVSPFRAKTNRQAWYDACKAFEGCPVSDLADHHAASPVSCHVRGPKAGQPEDVAEWVGWLVKQGVLVLEVQE